MIKAEWTNKDSLDLQPTCNQLATTEGDLISRQALCQYALNQKDRSVTPNDIMRFPSADSNANQHVQHVGSVDLISRQAVLALPRNVERTFFGEVISETVDVKSIEALPTIEPRRGKWIYNRQYGTAKVWTCSECGWNDIGEFNFCSNCGADMREEKNNGEA